MRKINLRKLIKNKRIVFGAAALAAVIAILYLVNTATVIDKTRVLDGRVSGLFSKFGLGEESLIKERFDIKVRGARRYIRVYREYDLPVNFSADGFAKELGAKLERTDFKIAGRARTATKDIESYAFIINFKNLDVLSLSLNKRKIARLPSVTKKYPHPKVAIVLDDFGNSKTNLEALFGIKRPLTLSVLPHLKYSAETAALAKKNGYEVILHLPLEPHRKDVAEEADTINSSMKESEIRAAVDSAIKSVPYIDGVSNHMGSKATEERPLMDTVLGELKKRNLYFFDSLTSEKSAASRSAKALGVRYAKRNIFLDNSNSEDYIKAQVAELERFAFKNGRAIAIGHDKKNTVKVLAEAMPRMAEEGVKFVRLSELVK